MGSDETEILRDLLERRISVGVAEWSLRGKYGSGRANSDFQKVYNYLDELAGMLDGGRETNEDIDRFRAFLYELGISFEV